jgi:hypothetical protein
MRNPIFSGTDSGKYPAGDSGDYPAPIPEFNQQF